MSRHQACTRHGKAKFSRNNNDHDDVISVYEIAIRHVQVRSEPNEDARIDGYILHRGQLVTVNGLRENSSSSSSSSTSLTTKCRAAGGGQKYSTGPYLRLADGSGWIFAKKAVGAGTVQQNICEPVPIRHHDWTFYVHPCRDVELYSQPDASSEVVEMLDPLQRIVCDAMIRHDETEWYHVVRGDAQGWVARQVAGCIQEDDNNDDSISTHSGMEGDDCKEADSFDVERHALIPERCIQFGLFAYTALQPIAVRTDPGISDASRTITILQRADVCLATVVIHDVDHINSVAAPANGPFLYLPTLGWVFEHKNHRSVMQKLHVEEGGWSLQMIRGMQAWCGPVLSTARPNHIQRYLFLDDDENDDDDDKASYYSSGSALTSDICIISPLTGATYYRVKSHPHHWLRVSNEMIHEVDVVRTASKMKQKTLLPVNKSHKMEIGVSSSKDGILNSDDGWTEDFVRGVASLVDDLAEDFAGELGKLVYIKDKVKITVACQTRIVTIQATDRRPATFADCSSKQLSAILRDPLSSAAGFNYLQTPPPVRLARQLSHTPTKSRMDSVRSTKSTLYSQLSDVEQQLAHHVTRKRELEHAIQRLDTTEIGSPLFSSPAGLSDAISAMTITTGLLRDTDLGDQVVGSLVSTEGSRTISHGSSGSTQLSSTFLAPVIASEVNLICGKCHHEFTSPRERRKHCLDVHGLYSCNFCTAVFDSQKKLHCHRDDRDHW